MTSSSIPLLRYPRELPITDRRESIISAINDHQVLVIVGETGSGKSTQIPKMCLEAGRGKQRLVGCTQPRRIAAITLAGRVAEELGREGRRLVGYKIRFQDKTSRSTRIKFMTDGILLAEAQKDRLFRFYDTLIIDEAHERTLNIDFLLGLIKGNLQKRPDLRVIISSATIDPEKFSRAFGGAPIIEVSGRTYPVEVWYRPLDSTDEDAGEMNYVDQAVASVEELKANRDVGRRGDILIFMPTESDIRETVQRLEEKRYFNTLVLPLFGRMAAGDQQRIFMLTAEEKIVVATNVAETSITIPRIKYVIDSGLARISQYNARSRTQSLPVLPISQASADQRKGRCGRVEAGICIRLYSEEDYCSRLPFTSPEIQRANLAEVILRMLFLRLGNVQDFPFLDPPSPAALKDGFAVLRELDAIDDHRRLTQHGRMMARLPLDPRLARMLLEAQKEGALREMSILVAALSAQDPKERPLDQEAKADQAHVVFRDQRSDFVTLLKIWEASLRKDAKTEQHPTSNALLRSSARKDSPAPDEFPAAGTYVTKPACGEHNSSSRVKDSWDPESALLADLRLPSRSRLRKFCREHFLSYRRMREWQDIHEEILNILDEIGGFRMNAAPASYEALHRSIVSGYLSHVSMRKERNTYLAAKNRLAMIFPGSGTFNKGGAWIVAGEMVQTSRLFARTVANIEPGWLEEVGRHLCRFSYSEPHWEKKRGQVVAFERVTLYGLTIVDRRRVNYSRINPKEAREIFIRSALVEGEIQGRHGFLEHNRRLIMQIEELESKTRRRDLLVDEERVYGFYDERLPLISDSRSFEKFLKDQGGDRNLRMTEADLLRTEPDFDVLRHFPDKLSVGSLELPLTYAFAPGTDEDGITVTVPVHTLPWLPKETFDWPVPGMLFEKILFLLKALPKSIRRQFVPVSDTAHKLVEKIPYLVGDFYGRLSLTLYEVTGVRVGLDLWERESLPVHLSVRYEIVDSDGRSLGVGRNLEELRSLAAERHDDHLWLEVRRRWEREDLTTLDCEEMPQKIEIGEDALGLMRHGYVGLVAEGRTAAFRLFDDPQKAMTASREGLKLLYELAFSTELKQLKKDWMFPSEMTPHLFFVGNIKQANALLQDYLMRELFGLHEPQWPDRHNFLNTLKELKGRLGVLGRERAQEVVETVNEREKTRSTLERFRKMAGTNLPVRKRIDLLFREMDALTPPDFLEHYRRSHIQQLPRYLRALRIRGERAYAAPEKDLLKAEQLEPYEKWHKEAVRLITPGSDDSGLRILDEYRWMLEEFKISLFSPEVKTRFRVSPKRLEEKWQEWELWKREKT